MKIITGIALIAGMAALAFIPGLGVVDAMIFAHLSWAATAAIMTGVAMTGAGLVIGGIADMLTHTMGSAIASRNPLSPWQVIYGEQMVGGTMVDIGETGDHDKYLHLVIVTACHQTNSFEGLWLDGKQVFFNGNPLTGCSDDNSTHYDLSGMPYNFKGRVYCQAFLGSPTQAACADYISRSSGHWTSNHTLSGRSYIYLRLTYDANVFVNGQPGVKTLWRGKTDILDPRTGLRGYSTNAALCINDFLMNKDYGVRCDVTEVNQPALIAAANLCDQLTTAGTIEPLYALNGVFNLASTPGEILNNMLSACAGQISYNAGQFSIYAAGWRGAVAAVDQTCLIGGFKYKSKRKTRELYNSVRGTFLSPNGPTINRGPGLIRGQVNPWDGQWTYTDIPDYAEDTQHGYASDVYNIADGQTLYLTTKFPFTTSVATCQRLAKIMLERNRQQGSTTLQCGLSCYGIQPLDIIEFSYPRYGWVNKLFEVTGTRLTFKSDNGKPPVPIVELDITETDTKVYGWNGAAEELSLSGQASPLLPSNLLIPGPTNVTLHSGPDTVVTGADGAQRSRILVSWTSPANAYVLSGGKLILQWEHTGTGVWEGTKVLAGSDTSCYIDNVTDGASYTVQISGVTMAGVASDWVAAGPLVVSNVNSVFSANNITYPSGETVASLKPAQIGADVTAKQPIVYAGTQESLVPNGNFILGDVSGWFCSQGSGSFSYFNWGSNGNMGLMINGNQSIGVASPTFTLVPGMRYRFTLRAWASSGTQAVYFGVNCSGTYQSQITSPSRIGGANGRPTDTFIANGSIQVNNAALYSFDWTCPSDTNFGAVAIYEWGGAAVLGILGVSCVPYGAVGASILSGSSSTLNGQGSIIPNQSFIFNADSVTNNSITVSWNSQGVYRADASILNVSGGSQVFSGLSASTTYYIYPYINVPNGTIGFASITAVSTPSSQLAIIAAFDGRAALPFIKDTTLAATNGGTGSGNPGGLQCPESQELVDVQGKDQIKAGDVVVGDLIKGQSLHSQEDVYRKVVAVSSEPCAAWRMVNGRRVSPCEEVRTNNLWVPAFKVPGATLDTMIGMKVHITVESDEYDESNYYLVAGDQPLLIHNFVPNPC